MNTVQLDDAEHKYRSQISKNCHLQDLGPIWSRKLKVVIKLWKFEHWVEPDLHNANFSSEANFSPIIYCLKFDVSGKLILYSELFAGGTVELTSTFTHVTLFVAEILPRSKNSDCVNPVKEETFAERTILVKVYSRKNNWNQD